MKIWIVYIGTFLLCVISIILILTNNTSNDDKIIGEWKELKWEYEMVNKGKKDSVKHISEEEENLIGQNLIIHKAEIWTFSPDGILKLTGAGVEKYIDWRVKGRGNALLLKYKNNTTEFYNITELTDDKMVLNFETDIQVRGIAKLTFEKIK